LLKKEVPVTWMGSTSASTGDNGKKISLFKAWIPYILIGLLHVLSRMPSLPFND